MKGNISSQHYIVSNLQQSISDDCLSSIANLSVKTNKIDEQYILIQKTVSNTNNLISNLNIKPLKTPNIFPSHPTSPHNPNSAKSNSYILDMEHDCDHQCTHSQKVNKKKPLQKRPFLLPTPSTSSKVFIGGQIHRNLFHNQQKSRQQL